MMIEVIENENGTWFTAIATKLEVSGMGVTRKDALDALKRSVRSTNKAIEFWKEHMGL